MTEERLDEPLNGEVRRLRQELAQARERIELLQHRKSSLLAMAIHDLRTPLAIIQGYSQLLAAELSPESDAAHLEYLANIVAHTESLAIMIENLVALDQAERGELQLSIGRVELNEMTGQAIAQVEGLTLVKGIMVQHDREQETVWVNADESQTTRLLYNLLRHTIKYSQPGGRLEIQTGHDESYGRASFKDPRRVLRPGMLGRLFDLADVRDKGASSLAGMDLGLVLARNVADAHGGRLSAVQGAEQGVTISLYLPLADD
ncbi:MAG TPA: HAMP domain-containing sensor histidine kinase [Promineifilum sp.]